MPRHALASIKRLTTNVFEMGRYQGLTLYPWKFRATEEEGDKAVHARPSGLGQRCCCQVVDVSHRFEQVMEDGKAAHSAFMNGLFLIGWVCRCPLKHEGDPVGGALFKPEGHVLSAHRAEALMRCPG